MINAAGSSAPDGRTAHGAGDFGEGTAFATPAGQRSQRSGISRQPLADPGGDSPFRSEEHTSELQSLMRISYAVFCLKKKKQHDISQQPPNIYHHTQTTY